MTDDEHRLNYLRGDSSVPVERLDINPIRTGLMLAAAAWMILMLAAAALIQLAQQHGS